MIHVREATPDIPEEIAERVFEVEETQEPLYERDATGVLLRTSDTVTIKRGRYRVTGRRVRTGSTIQGDLRCRDCGADLVAAGDRPFRYLICGRLNLRIPDDKGRPEGGRWLPAGVDPKGRLMWRIVEAEEPTAGSVLECGRWNLEETP